MTRIVFFTSGTGTTIDYIVNKYNICNGNKLFNTICIVYEPNEIMEKNIKHYPGQHFRVCMDNFKNNDDFHSTIEKHVSALMPDIIVLSGWMHILPKMFIEDINCKNGKNIKIINLHPTLQYQLIGRDIYPKIWKMYTEGMISETGAMVHYVTDSIDRGELICEKKLNLLQCQTYEEYYDKMHGSHVLGIIGIENECLEEALLILIKQCSIPIINNVTPETFINENNLVLEHRGKVRDIYKSSVYKDFLFILTSDRISANDIVISYILQKGILLNQINAYWHKLFGIEQMVCNSMTNLMIVRKMHPIPLEIIVSRRLLGSLWKSYNKGLRMINGYELKDGMVEGDLFENLIVTPTTKGKNGLPITFDEIIKMGIVNKKELNIIIDKATGLFEYGEQIMKRLGIEIIDTKFEFAFDSDGKIQFIDEIFTPDSSRFIVDGVLMDKNILRRWATDNENFILSHNTHEDGCRSVELPEDVSKQLIANYKGVYDKLITKNSCFRHINFNKGSPTIEKALTTLSSFVVIIAGSKSDYNHVMKIRNELVNVNILCFIYYASAHKNTEIFMEIINTFDMLSNVKCIYITVDELSNVLSSVLSANTNRPVISCPPFADKTDYNINIHSSLQMPSGVPAAVILRTDNVAKFCKNLFF